MVELRFKACDAWYIMYRCHHKNKVYESRLVHLRVEPSHTGLTLNTLVAHALLQTYITIACPDL
jgi:hypothetical protein